MIANGTNGLRRSIPCAAGGLLDFDVVRRVSMCGSCGFTASEEFLSRATWEGVLAAHAAYATTEAASRRAAGAGHVASVEGAAPAGISACRGGGADGAQTAPASVASGGAFSFELPDGKRVHVTDYKPHPTVAGAARGFVTVEDPFRAGALAALEDIGVRCEDAKTRIALMGEDREVMRRELVALEAQEAVQHGVVESGWRPAPVTWLALIATAGAAVGTVIRWWFW